LSAAPLLSVERLTRDYGGILGRGSLFNPAQVRHRALDGVSFAVAEGEILGVVGESGCGKSTLARLVAALDRPTAGRVVLDGAALFDLAPRVLKARRRDVQMVFQDPYGSLDPRHTIGRIVAEPLHLLDPRPGPRERAMLVAEMLGAVGLAPDTATLYPHQFSGGQRQRIAVARALITAPKLVVADEPVSALDLSIQAQVLNLILDLRQDRGTAFLFISHNLGAVQAIADRVVVMYRGRVVESGPAGQVFAAPLHPYSALLASAEPTLTDLDRPPVRPTVARSEGPPADWAACAFRHQCARATERCSRETPALRSLAPGRSAACHHPLT